ncbi:MAG: hypothetical protein HOP17_09335 [Acidobacteria bacterium]|nr:hypothetical protein [Acidobacteriota bacterium]
MRFISETAGIEKLADIRSEFTSEIRGSYEHKARPCSACDSPGICCRDAHFVNVRITRLEAAGIDSVLKSLGPGRRNSVHARVDQTIATYRLTDDDGGEPKTYACPLFESGTGCLVHETAKPLPCIAHACYDDPGDLPPDELLVERETEIFKLNRLVYGKDIACSPIPLAIARFGK